MEPSVVNMRDAKTHLSRLVDSVLARRGRDRPRREAGGEARALRGHSSRYRFGLAKGRIWMSDDFDDELPLDELLGMIDRGEDGRRGGEFDTADVLAALDEPRR